MSTPQNDAFDPRFPKPLDRRYLKNEIIPWTSVAEVNTALTLAYRYQGLTVLIGSTEYWYIGGVADGNLVPKNQANNSTSLTLSADGFYTFPLGVLIIALIVTPSVPITFKAGSSVGAEDFVPAMPLPAGVPTAISLFLPRNATQSIYFGGISGSTTTVVIKTL